MKNLTPTELREKIQSGEKFIVDMYADWCGPCRMLGPIIESISSKLEDSNHEVKIYKFNIEQDKQLSADLGVRNIPTIKSFCCGENTETKIGVLSEQQINEMADSLLD
jgi:thioredoxin 1